MKKRSGDDDRDYDFSASTILTSRYGHESRRLIHLIEKNLYYYGYYVNFEYSWGARK